MAMRVNHGRLTKIIYLLHSQNPLLDARISEISRRLLHMSIYSQFLSQILFPLQLRGSVGVNDGPSLKTLM